jgi:hypothetical protein
VESISKETISQYHNVAAQYELSTPGLSMTASIRSHLPSLRLGTEK